MVLALEKNPVGMNGQADFDFTTGVIPLDQFVKAHDWTVLIS